MSNLVGSPKTSGDTKKKKNKNNNGKGKKGQENSNNNTKETFQGACESLKKYVYGVSIIQESYDKFTSKMWGHIMTAEGN